MIPPMVLGRDARSLAYDRAKSADIRINSRQTRSATYVLPFSEQNGKTG
jgi:hypothetical protein